MGRCYLCVAALDRKEDPMKPINLAGAAIAALVATASLAQEWPNGPVHIVARIVGEKLSARIGKALIVDNKPGAGGNIGTDAVAKAAPDGQTIGLSIAGPLAVNALLYKSMSYDPERDLALITIAATQPSVLVVTPRLGVSTTAELVAALKANPGKYNYSSMGGGSISHLAM